MAWTAAETARIEDIEATLVDLQRAIKNLASQLQVRQLTLLRQSEITTLESAATELEARLHVLEENL
jgi:hypothetical protein